MYTQSNAYVRKLSSFAILALLLASAILVLLPIAAVYGSTGHPDIGIVTSQTTLTGTFTAAVGYVNVTAGPSAVAGTDCGATFPTSCSHTGYFAINFNSGGMLFSGSQFALYLSKDGYSEISAGDIPIAGGLTDNAPFIVSTLSATKVTTLAEKNGTYYLGYGYLSGPVPTAISNAYKYIKIFDGATTSVAVTEEYITIMPGIRVTPTTGVAGTSVAISGGGFPASSLVNINYSFSYVEWKATTTTTETGQWVTGIPTGNGYFTTTATILDTKQAINPVNYEVVIPTVTITLTAATHTYPRTFYTTASATFTENTRVFNQEYSYRPDGSIGASATLKFPSAYGNDSGLESEEPTVNDLPSLSAYVTGSIGLEGNYSAIGFPVAIWIGSTQVASATPNGKSGGWVANFTVPDLPGGSNTVKVINNGVMYEFTIDIVPTLVLTPSSGPIGTTVTVTAYGFSPTGSKAPVVLYWYEETYYTYTNYWLANATVGINGAFNNTQPVTFVVPSSYGGGHYVTASSVCAGVKGTCKAGGTAGVISTPDTLGIAVFTVTPTLVICVTSTDCGSGSTNANTVSVNSNTRTLLVATGTGFGYTYADDCDEPGGLCFEDSYQVNIDNALYSDFSTYALENGDIYVNFTAAGFQPGLHQVEFYGCETWVCIGAPAAVAYFNVTTIGAYVVSGVSLPAATISQINTIYTNVNTILGWQSTITGINTNINTILGWGPTITGINTNINTILGWGPTITNINSTVKGLATTLSTIQGTLATIIGDITTATTAATTAATAATAASTAASNTKSSVSDTETYVLVIVVLAAITLVLELAILVRKLD